MKIPRLSAGSSVFIVSVLALCFLAGVLVPGLELASGLARSSAQLRFVGEQQRRPAMIVASLESIRDRLGSHAYVQDTLNALRDATAKLDAALRDIESPAVGNWFSGGEPIAGRRALTVQELWAKERSSLEPLLAFAGVPYQDDESTGTVLTDSGKQLELDVNAAVRTGRRSMKSLDDELTAIASDLQSRNERSASRLRLVMSSGVGVGLALMVLVSALLLARQRQERSLRAARQQTADILRTVKDGLFLLDRNLAIGASYSNALESLFQRKDLPGLSFEHLLRGIVSEKTLATALKFVEVLWAERTKENLVKSINPLGEVEVSVDDGKGKVLKRVLQFDFHRVRDEGRITQVLVSVSDVTARVDLAHELQSAQSQAQSHVDTLLGILHVDPSQLASFLGDSNAAMKMINAVLREPAREETAFRKKLDTLFRLVHSVKGEAAALGLSSIEGRAHSFEDDLKSLRDRTDLSGNDFLPLVIKLDDLLNHLQALGDLVTRLSRFHAVANEQIGRASSKHTDTTVLDKGVGAALGAPAAGVVVAAGAVAAAGAAVAVGAVPGSGMAGMLQQLTVRMADEQGKQASLQCVGFDTIPDSYRRIVKDISVQVVRNAVVHGIETADERAALGKPTVGTLRLLFQDLGQTGYQFVAEDDGRGLSAERIKASALKKGFITADKASTLNARQVFALLFQAGFSTLEHASEDAGRGVGMNLIANLMQQLGGKVALASLNGKFTRLTLTLPQLRHTDTEAA